MTGRIQNHAAVTILLCLLFGLVACRRNQIEVITIKGSDTEVNLVLQLAEAYMQAESDVSISITGGGSGVGIAALLNGKTDIANASRELNVREHAIALERGISLREQIFALDALAVIVHPSVPVDSLELSTLGQLYAGIISNWRALGGADVAVSLYGRQSNSGTFMYFRDRVLGCDFAPTLKQMNGNAQILEAVKNDPGAIGYIGMGYLTNHAGQVRDGIKVLRLKTDKHTPAVSPLDKTSVSAGQYPLTRPLYHFTAGAPSPRIKSFYAFEQEAIGRQIIEANGYLPVADPSAIDLTVQ